MITASGTAAIFVLLVSLNMQHRCDNCNPPVLTRPGSWYRGSRFPGPTNLHTACCRGSPVRQLQRSGLGRRQVAAHSGQVARSGDPGHPLDVDALDVVRDGD